MYKIKFLELVFKFVVAPLICVIGVISVAHTVSVFTGIDVSAALLNSVLFSSIVLYYVKQLEGL